MGDKVAQEMRRVWPDLRLDDAPGAQDQPASDMRNRGKNRVPRASDLAEI